MNNWDFAQQSCLIQLADGTYTGHVSISGRYVGTLDREYNFRQFASDWPPLSGPGGMLV
jgi:hypothetical protein